MSTSRQKTLLLRNKRNPGESFFAYRARLKSVKRSITQRQQQGVRVIHAHPLTQRAESPATGMSRHARLEPMVPYRRKP